MKKQTFLVFIGAAHDGQLFHTVTANSIEKAFELVVAYLVANGFEAVKYDKELKTIFCLCWCHRSFMTAKKVADWQCYGGVYLDIQNAADWNI